MAIFGRNRGKKDVYQDYLDRNISEESVTDYPVPDSIGRVNQENGQPLYVEEPGSSKRRQSNINILRDVFNDRTFNFKHGLEFQYNQLNGADEDPVIFGFDVVIDAIDSPLFNDVEGFIAAFGPNIPEIQSRGQIYTDFIEHVSQFFERNDIGSSELKNFKAHYLKKIGGLEKLIENTVGGLKSNQQFVKYTEDLITFTMYEDLNINGGYLAMLYKMLSYSRMNGRLLVPDNLLRFDMAIVISEVRNYNKVKRAIDGGDIDVLNDNVSRYIYNLYDCQFVFDKMSHPGEVANSEFSHTEDFEFSVAYKFSTLEMEKFKLTIADGGSSLQDLGNDDVRYLNNKNKEGNTRYEGGGEIGETTNGIVDLGFRSGDAYIRHSNVRGVPPENEEVEEASEIDNLQTSETAAKKESLTPTEVDKGELDALVPEASDLGPISGAVEDIDKGELDALIPAPSNLGPIAGVVEGVGGLGGEIGQILKKTGEFAAAKFKRKRDELINNTLNKVRTSTGLRRISSPINVYQNPTIANFALGQFRDFVNNSVTDFINNSPVGRGKDTLSEQNQKYDENIQRDIPPLSNSDDAGFRPGGE